MQHGIVWRLAPLALAVAVGLATAGLLAWRGIQLGNVAEWISAIGTTGAFAVALFLLAQGQRERRDARLQARRAQASKVSVDLQYKGQRNAAGRIVAYTGGSVVVSNRSDEPIFNVVVLIRDSDRHGLATAEPFQIVAGGAARSNRLPDPALARAPALNAIYSFVDNAGVAWQRDNLTGGLRERPTPPWVDTGAANSTPSSQTAG